MTTSLSNPLVVEVIDEFIDVDYEVNEELTEIESNKWSDSEQSDDNQFKCDHKGCDYCQRLSSEPTQKH